MNRLMKELFEEIRAHPTNRSLLSLGYDPVYAADERARVLVVGHAPGIKAQTTKIPWGDASGERLKKWLGITEEEFRNPELFALVPMDFYYQGRGTSGDNPPRKCFASLWHPRLLELMPKIELIIPAGQYAIKYYLDKSMGRNLTETVRNFEAYLPEYFPIVHPSPINNRWLVKNLWFEEEVVPQLQERVSKILRSY